VSLYTQYRQMEADRETGASTEPLYLLQPIDAHATLYYGLGSELTVQVSVMLRTLNGDQL
jgi:hypothetical protein